MNLQARASCHNREVKMQMVTGNGYRAKYVMEMCVSCDQKDFPDDS